MNFVVTKMTNENSDFFLSEMDERALKKNENKNMSL